MLRRESEPRPWRLRNGGESHPPADPPVLPSLSERLRAAEPHVDLTAEAARLHEALVKRLDGEKLRHLPAADARARVREAAAALLTAGDLTLPADARDQLIRMVVDEVLGYGPLQPLLDDPAISEVMVNGAGQIYVECDGLIQLTPVHFRDDTHVRRVAERILSVIGRRVDESSPMVDARLPDGSRVNITIPPATPKFSTITIRKFRTDRYAMTDLIAAGSLDARMQKFLSICTAHKLNILIAGGTGSGKTTMLNAISAFIPSTERIVTIEDPIELALQQAHVLAMEARPPDMTGKHAITQRDLLRNALRMRPDRIIVGEIRGPEAFEMLQAMNTGHEGSLSTVHANSPRDALARVESMVLMAGMELPLAAIREQLASAVHLIVQLQRFSDGVRRLVKITEVTGMESGHLTLQDIFCFRARGRAADGAILGEFRATGLRPTFSDELEGRGATLVADLFWEAAA